MKHLHKYKRKSIKAFAKKLFLGDRRNEVETGTFDSLPGDVRKIYFKEAEYYVKHWQEYPLIGF